MKILQNTTDFNNKQVMEIIDFVKPNNLPTLNFDVRVNHCSSGAYTGYSIPERARPTVVLIIAKPKNENIFPYYRDETSEVRRPYRRVTLYYEKFDEKNKQYRLWRITHSYQSIKDKEKKMSQGGYVSQMILSREEALVSIAAHELRHLWHVNHTGKRGKVRGAKGKYSDRDADAYAIRKTREWRKLHNPREMYPDLSTIGIGDGE